MNFRLGPDEGLGLGVVGVDEVVDVLPELFDRGEGRVVEGLPCRIENQISTWLSQEARVGVKWKRTLG